MNNYSNSITKNILIYQVFKDQYIQLQFSNSVEGKLYLPDFIDPSVLSGIFLEYKNHQWFLGTNDESQILGDEMIAISYVTLLNHQKYTLRIRNEECVIFTEEISDENNIFYNYNICGCEGISIGRSMENDIVCSNPHISRHHATITVRKGKYYVSDSNSANGTYVNGKRIRYQELCLGDVVFILGLKIVVGVGFLSINAQNKSFILNNRFVPYHQNIEAINLHSVKTYTKETNNFFNRLPRASFTLETPEIIIEDPPFSLDSSQAPMLLRMGGSMVMGGSAVMRGNYTSLFSMLLFPIMNKLYDEKEKKKYEELRVEKYTQYLNDLRRTMLKEKKREENILNDYYPPLSTVVNYPVKKDRLWERSYRHEDFLSVRIGAGDLPFKANLSYSDKKFSLDEDPLEKMKYTLLERDYHLSDVPILLSLKENFICGVTGTKEHKIDFFLKMIVQLCFLHSYDEIKLVMLLDKEILERYPFLRYLPHIWNDDKSFRFLSTDLPSSYLISQQLNKIIVLEDSKEPTLDVILKNRPYYVVLAWNKQLLESIEILKPIMKDDKNHGVSIITFFEDVMQQSKELIELKESGEHTITYLSEHNSDGNLFHTDVLDESRARKMMNILANISLGSNKKAYSMPKMITFLELFKVGRIDYLNPLKRWKENNPVKSLAVPVGVATDGSPFMLDLHEKYQGPHGLVAGMTGSGKSEFIITYILSLAVNFHPYEVAFLLIDYKGGGLAGAFENKQNNIHLPHLVGTITNLDGSSITRALMSIESELKRRQRVFNEAKMANDEGTMDIYTYQKLYRSGKVREPMPHLFIISDEFAELKTQEPEFMDQLISAARIGRSLGVHLILATQKPAGVVNDQINSNTKFRVCLKVQTRADSDEMLRRPEAAEIKETGRFYLQVGYNEFFALGQSAWCGAPYEPQEEALEPKDDYVQFIDDAGQNIVQVKPVSHKEKAENSQIVAIVKYLSKLAEKEHIETRKLWLEPLEADYSITELQREYPVPKENLEVTLGMIDDPKEQKQFPYILDFAKCQNLMVIGGNQTGKSTMLQSIAYSLMRNYSPKEINFYMVDFSGGQLKMFDNTRYCGGVWTEGEEESIIKFFDLLKEFINDRKKMFQQVGVSSYESYKEIDELPLILVMIDNITALSSWPQGKSMMYDLHKLIRDCNSVGIKFVITSASYDDIAYNVKKELRTRFVLDAKNRFEYGDILGVYCRFEPEALPGRGFIRLEDQILECHIGRFLGGETEQQRIALLKRSIEELSERYSDLPPVRRIPEILEDERYVDFCSRFSPRRIPLGYSVNEVKDIAMPLKQLYCASIYLGNSAYIPIIMGNYLYAAMLNKMELVIVKKNQNSLFDSEEIKEQLLSYGCYSFYESTADDLKRLKYYIYQELVIKRKEIRNEFCEQKGISPQGNNVMQQCFDYLYERSVPVLILFESFAESCLIAAQEQATLDFYETVFMNGKGYNFYFMAFNYADDSNAVMNNKAFLAFKKHGFALLYGGQYDKQYVCSLPLEYRNLSNPIKKAGTCLMLYHSQLFQIWMPCYVQQTEEIDLDDVDII